MKVLYARTMEKLYITCIAVSAAALVLITLAIPYGVFMRYAAHSAASWPEPFSVLLMVLFSFVGGAAVFRAKVHIAVQALTNAIGERPRRVMSRLVDACMGITCVFMVVYGIALSRATWNQSIAEFPGLSVGLTYLPIPIGGLITLLFIIERLWCGDPAPGSVMYTDQPDPE